MFLADEIEVLRDGLPRGTFRSALFDFDGTLSLIREGWPQVMIPMMVGVLRETGTAESDGAQERPPDLPRGTFRSALFDFDGTLSLIREGWPQVMIPMMVGVLRETGTAESD